MMPKKLEPLPEKEIEEFVEEIVMSEEDIALQKQIKKERQRRKDKVKKYLELRKQYLEIIGVDKYCNPELEATIISKFVDLKAIDLFTYVKRRVLEVSLGMLNESEEIKERIRISRWWFEGNQRFVVEFCDPGIMGDPDYIFKKKINIRILLR